MSRTRPVVAAACLAVLIFAALPAAGAAQRDAAFQNSAIGASEPMGERLVGSVLSWGRLALSWLQAILAAEHGQIAQDPVVAPNP